MPSIVPHEQTLEDTGYCAYFRGVKRCELATEAEQRGWDEAYGEDCYYRELWEEAQEQDRIGRSESTQPYLW